MAIVALTKNVANYNAPKVATLTASNTDGLEYELTDNDESTMLVVYNSSADTAYDITVKAPTNANIIPAVDKVVEIAAGKVALIMVESAKYLDPTTGKVTLDSENAALTAALYTIK